MGEIIKMNIPQPIIKIESIKKNINPLINSYFDAKTPANKFPAKDAKNHVPINNEANCFGASFDTSDKPMGDKHSSAIVAIK